MRQLNDVLLIDIGAVFGILAIVKWGTLKVIIHYLECIAITAIYGSVGIITNVFIEERLSHWGLHQFLKFHLILIKWFMPEIFHHGVLNACSR